MGEPMVTDLPLLLKVEEFARLARISRSLAYERVSAGEIPAIRVGTTWRIPRDRAMRFLGLLDDEVIPELPAQPAADLAPAPNQGPDASGWVRT
jgi:excisionase family DNA binding protein